MKKTITETLSLIFLGTFVFSGCSTMLSEFFRGETSYQYKHGNQMYRSGEYDKARDCFNKVVELDPDHARAYAGLGNVALMMSDFDAAEQYYNKAISTDPKLKATLTPLLAVVLKEKAGKTLEKYDVNLRKVLRLLLSGREIELVGILSEEVTLDLLARDTLSLTLEELIALREIIMKKAASSEDPVRCRLFYGYFLFYLEKDYAALRAFESSIDELSDKDRQEACVIMGRLYERMHRSSEAADAYLKAVEAGKPMSDVAPYLAKIYGIPPGALTAQYPSKGNGAKKIEHLSSVEAKGLSSGAISQTNKNTETNMKKTTFQSVSGRPEKESSKVDYQRMQLKN